LKLDRQDSGILMEVPESMIAGATPCTRHLFTMH
jgi:hypothetical protein